MHRIESLLFARQFLVPQLVGDELYFVSNLSGHMSLYRMKKGGSIPEPLLPPEIALQNPHLLSNLFKVIPDLGQILVMIDQDGSEDYKPMLIPMSGGYPTPLFTDELEAYRYFVSEVDLEKSLLYLTASSNSEALNHAYKIDLKTGEKIRIASSKYGGGISGKNKDHSKIVIVEGYSAGDHVVKMWAQGRPDLLPIYGTPIEERTPDFKPEPNSIYGAEFVRGETHLVFYTTLFEDAGGIGWLDLAEPEVVHPGEITGIRHSGRGEFSGYQRMQGNRYLVMFNIDGSDWVYEAELDEDTFQLNLERVLVGEGELSDGVLESIYYEKQSGDISLAFSTAVSPVQIYTLEGPDRKVVQHTGEKLLGVPAGLLSKGEDYPFDSHDGLRISARLYMPHESFGFKGPRPLVYYVHGGPQSQERPDFAWFSMPLIQFLAMKGFAVFVPNVRGSSGYGMAYMKKVDRDWGGDDRLDHVHAMTEVLSKDERIDTSRAAVVGRSYGGYMSLTLAARHPELWKASCDMFGPYDLLTFLDRLPPTWQPYFHISVGHPEKDREFLIERSPRTYFDRIGAPMLVIQGKNDPRVKEQESRDVVDHLNSLGKDVTYLMFEDEGHDMVKFENKVRCYNAITDFFVKALNP